MIAASILTTKSFEVHGSRHKNTLSVLLGSRHFHLKIISYFEHVFLVNVAFFQERGGAYDTNAVRKGGGETDSL